MELASHAESPTRRRLAAGVNRLGAQVDHLSGLLHTDPLRQSYHLTKDSRGPLDDPSARVFGVFLIEQSVSIIPRGFLKCS